MKKSLLGNKGGERGKSTSSWWSQSPAGIWESYETMSELCASSSDTDRTARTSAFDTASGQGRRQPTDQSNPADRYTSATISGWWFLQRLAADSWAEFEGRLTEKGSSCCCCRHVRHYTSRILDRGWGHLRNQQGQKDHQCPHMVDMTPDPAYVAHWDIAPQHIGRLLRVVRKHNRVLSLLAGENRWIIDRSIGR